MLVLRHHPVMGTPGVVGTHAVIVGTHEVVKIGRGLDKKKKKKKKINPKKRESQTDITTPKNCL